ncbi:unnamed protein product [Withania somnifera]
MASAGGVFDDNGWGYCTEQQLEQILLSNLDYIYNAAIANLVSLGYHEHVALKTILRNGYCYGGMDILATTLHKSLSDLSNVNAVVEDTEHSFADLRELEEYSLASMLCLLQQLKPHLSRGDAMWYLLMSDLHLGRATMLEIPVSNVEDIDSSPVPTIYRFHAGWGFRNAGANEFPLNGFFSYASESSLQREIDCPKRFNLTPSMKSLLKRNVPAFAAGLRENSKHLQNQSQAYHSSLPSRSISGSAGGLGQSDESQNLKSEEVVSSVLSKFRDLNLDDNSEQVHGQMDQKILNLIRQIKDLERQVKERKDWAHQKAIQAARKLSNDLTELKILSMEREEAQRLKKGKQAAEETTTKSFTYMEAALQEASGNVDHANLTAKRLENENAEIRAEMEAYKLNTLESATTCLEVVKREKKCLKKLGAWEKQKNKLLEDIAAEKQNISDLQQQQVEVEAAQNEAEAKWRQEQRAKEQALAQVEEERRLKEAAEATNKRNYEALRLRIEIDFQRHKDDLQWLEQDLSQLKLSNELLEGNVARILHDFDTSEDSSEKDISGDRKCLICLKGEVSVVFLPCVHQVLCALCNDNYRKTGRAICPYCRVPIEQRIQVFGVTS